MAVYVDPVVEHSMNRADAHTRRNGSHWSHMSATTRDELHEFAAALGLKREWFQDHARLWHYDITPPKRALAIRLGAIELGRVEWVKRRIADDKAERQEEPHDDRYDDRYDDR